MEPSPKQIAAIEHWLRSKFPSYVVTSGDIPLRDVVLFRAHSTEPRSPKHELELSYEAFEDNTIDTILADLNALKAAERLQSSPNSRLLYDRFRQLRAPPSTNPGFRPDFALYSENGELEMVGEVKKSRETSPAAAARIRRNLLAHDAVPNAPFFLIVFPDRLYLWKDEQSHPDSLPSQSAPITDVLRDYLGQPASDSHGLAEESIELALNSWFRDLATATREPSDQSEADRVVVGSGLYSVLRRGRIVSGSRR